MFSNKNDFRENDFFSVFGYITENVPENILQCCVKDRVEGVGGEACVFGKSIFQILTKDFLVNGNYFPFDHHFTAKQTPANLKIFSKKYFTAK